MKKIYSIVLMVFGLHAAFAQQDAQYTQYMYNMSVINPAYTTSTESIINFGGFYRSQWTGVDGAPTTSNFFIHSPISDKMEAGISIVSDDIGDIVNESNVFADLAYKIDMEEKGTLSFGVKVGATFFNVDYNGLEFESGDMFTDPLFMENLNRTNFNMGIGMYYNTDNYYIGFSVPTLLKGKHLDEENGRYRGVENPHMFLTGGYVFDLSSELKFKPAFMLKGVKGAPLSLDVTGNVLYNNRIEFGVGYRTDDAVMGLFNILVTPELKMGYAYDYTLSNHGPYSNGSHEFMILYNLDLYNFNKGFDKSPRFF